MSSGEGLAYILLIPEIDIETIILIVIWSAGEILAQQCQSFMLATYSAMFQLS